MSVIRSAVIAAVLTLAAGTAHAQQVRCGNPVDLVEHLSVDFGEVPAVRGLDGGGQLVQTFANLETGTWTLVLFVPNGPACIMAAGTDWEAIEYVAPAPKGRPS